MCSYVREKFIYGRLDSVRVRNLFKCTTLFRESLVQTFVEGFHFNSFACYRAFCRVNCYNLNSLGRLQPAIFETAKCSIAFRKSSQICNQILLPSNGEVNKMRLDFNHVKGIESNCDFMQNTVGIVRNKQFPRCFHLVLKRRFSKTNCILKQSLTSKVLFVFKCTRLPRFFMEFLPHGIFVPEGGVTQC